MAQPTIAQANAIIDGTIIDFAKNNSIEGVQLNTAQSPILTPPPADQNDSEAQSRQVPIDATTELTPNYKELKRIDGTFRTLRGVVYKGVKR